MKRFLLIALLLLPGCAVKRHVQTDQQFATRTCQDYPTGEECTKFKFPKEK
jgi:outer membrane biogenesis lipoprotein LolB